MCRWTLGLFLVAVLCVGADQPVNAQSDRPVPTLAKDCIQIGKGPERPGDKDSKRYLHNTCARPIEIALCHGAAGRSEDHCGTSPKYFRWRFVLKPDTKNFNKFQVPEGVQLVYNACFGTWGAIDTVDTEGNIECHPPVPPPVDIESEIPCGDQRTSFRLKVRFNRQGARAVEIIANKKRRVLSAASLAKLPEMSASVPSIVPLPLVEKSGTRVVALGEDVLANAVCGESAATSRVPTQIFRKLQELIERRPGEPCKPPTTKGESAAKPGHNSADLYIKHCFQRTKSAGAARG